MRLTHPPSTALPAALLALATLAGCAPDARAHLPAPATPLAIPVRAAAVERGPVERPIRATGLLAARRAYDLSFRAGGVLAAVAVEAGTAVRRGQVLARLEATDLAAGLRQAQEAARKAERDLDRVRLLRGGDAVPPAALQDAETGAALAREAVRAAGFQLENAVLLAPEDGFVDRRLAEPGEVVSPGRAVLHLSGAGRGWVVRVDLPEVDVVGLAPGRPATVALDARPGLEVAGRVVEVARQPVRATGTWQVEVAFDPSALDGPLLPGLTARVAIARQVEAAGSVPLAALLEGDGASGVVYALEGERARRVPVRVAFLQGDRAVLAGGLEGVERVATEGAPWLSDGARVRVAP